MKKAEGRRQKVLLWISAFCILTSAFVSCAPQATFLERKVNLQGKTYAYRVWLPKHYTRLHRWPVIVFLHGSGESGDDNLRQLTAGLPLVLRHDPARYPAIVVIPQCPFDQEWYGAMESVALAELEKSIKEFRGDRRRIYLTGMSMGGAGVWYLARHAGRFAAIAPVCGEVTRAADDPFPFPPPPDLATVLAAPDPFAALAARIGKTPVWAFHGAGDPVISVEQSRRMTSALRARGGNVRYTEYAGQGHNVWDLAYNDPALPRWLFGQRRH